jgi:hypothetical protein
MGTSSEKRWRCEWGCCDECRCDSESDEASTSRKDASLAVRSRRTPVERSMLEMVGLEDGSSSPIMLEWELLEWASRRPLLCE